MITRHAYDDILQFCNQGGLHLHLNRCPHNYKLLISKSSYKLAPNLYLRGVVSKAISSLPDLPYPPTDGDW